MPTLEKGGRTKTVETRTLEEIPLDPNENQGLGMPWTDYLDQCSPVELELTIVKIYRTEPRTQEGYLLKLSPAQAIDEEWIRAQFGGGVYAVQIKSKSGKSHYERNIRIPGEPKLQTSANGNGAAPVPAAPPSASDSFLNRLADMFERQNERIERLMERSSTPMPAPGPSAAQESVVGVMAEASKAAIGVVSEAAKAAISSQPHAGATPVDSFDRDLQRLKVLKEIVGSAQTAAPPDPLAQITGVAAMIKAVKEIGGNGDGVDWKAMLVEKGLDHIPELVDLGKTIMAGQNKQAEELRRREEARKASLDRIAQIQNRTTVPGAPAVPVPAQPASDAAPVSPLNVVPISSVHASPAGFAPAPPSEPAVETPPAPPISAESEKEMLDRFFKQRIVQLVAEGDEPESVLDFIDRANPVYGAIIGNANEKQIRQFLAADPILAEITRLANYEKFLRGLLEVIAADREEDQGEPPAGSPPPLKMN